VVRVRGAGGGRVGIAGVLCYRPGDRPPGLPAAGMPAPQGRAQGLAPRHYRDLIIATHREL